MATNKKQTKASVLAEVQALIAGTQKNTPKGTFILGNATYTAAALIKLLQGLVTAMTTQTAQAKAAKDALTALRALQAQVNPVIQDYKDLLQAQYGSATTALADYGLEPHKARAQASVEDKAAAVAKRQATREARGTEGPKAKSAIHGTTAAPAEATPAVTTAAPAKPAS